MKILKTYEGVTENVANEVWDDIESGAKYSFNLAHSVTYSVISYWSMYLKTHYPAEFFAASLSTVDNEDHLQALIIDAQKYNIFVTPPDINISTDRFEFRFTDDETHLVAPFNKLKGLSDKTSDAILEARELAGGKFLSRDDLLKNVRKRNCNVKHVKILEDVGSFASIEPETLQIRHPDRLIRQIELMPGLITAFVKADRYTKLSDITIEASGVVRGIKECDSCSLKDERHCIPTAGSKIKFMVITDGPTTSESEGGKMLSGLSCKNTVKSISDAGLKKSNGYYTSLVKVQKPKELKSFTNEHLLSCRKFVDKEIEMINPPVIVCLGGASIRYFYPDIKGSWSELCGKVIYNKELRASIVCGINPQMIYFRDEAQKMLDDVFKIVYEMVS